MINWHLAPGHTLRAGVSKAYRPPSNYEKFVNLRYDIPVLGPYVFARSTGQTVPETLLAKELGYMGEFPSWRLGLDVRLFQEQLDKLIVLPNNPIPRDYVNESMFELRGLEYQLKWMPWQGAQISFSQTYIDNTHVAPGYDTIGSATPRLASSLAYFQRLPGNLNLTLLHNQNSTAGLVADKPQSLSRTDLRLAKEMRWGARRGELALVVQNLGSAYADYKKEFLFRQQAFITLRLDD
jgi:iron complex outermembrane receptor protein